MKKIIIFIGPPGSGKGTQARELASRLHYGYVATGDLFRSLLQKTARSTDEEEAVAAMAAGRLVPDALVYRLAFAAAGGYLDQGQGIVLDGAIRTTAQAEAYQKFFAEKNLANEILVINIVLSDAVARERLTTRRVCAECRAVFPASPVTGSTGRCGACGGLLTTRSDDDAGVVEQRVRDQGNRALLPIVEYYKASGVLSDVDGNQTIEDVRRDVERSIGVTLTRNL